MADPPLKSAKHHLATGEPVPKGVSPEDLPCNMPASADAWGHGDGYIPRTFYRLTPFDAPKRRALWMRFPPCAPEDNYFRPDGSLVELRAGREGDDGHVVLKEGDVLTRETIAQLIDILLTMRFGLEEFLIREEKGLSADHYDEGSDGRTSE